MDFRIDAHIRAVPRKYIVILLQLCAGAPYYVFNAAEHEWCESELSPIPPLPIPRSTYVHFFFTYYQHLVCGQLQHLFVGSPPGSNLMERNQGKEYDQDLILQNCGSAEDCTGRAVEIPLGVDSVFTSAGFTSGLQRIFHKLIEFLLNGDELKECGTHTKNAFTYFDIPKMFQVRVLHQSHQGRLEDDLELRVQSEAATTHPFVRVSASINFFLALEDFDEGVDSGIETCGEF
ncbi:hypothetical protein B0H13DRAFT_1856235 [Mycena leptocephala]|nr:hypothetical protein B0H13DRAFT_1856235 [Mycena leptocephala]